MTRVSLAHMDAEVCSMPCSVMFLHSSGVATAHLTVQHCIACMGTNLRHSERHAITPLRRAVSQR